MKKSLNVNRNFNYSHLKLDFSEEDFFMTKDYEMCGVVFSHRLQVFTYFFVLVFIHFWYVWMTVALHCYCVFLLVNRLEASV